MSANKPLLSKASKQFIAFGFAYIALCRGLTIFVVSLCTDAQFEGAQFEAAKASQTKTVSAASVSIEAPRAFGI